MRKLSLLEIKSAILTDSRFRELFPELKEDFEKIDDNPSCSCNIPIYHKVLRYKERLTEYFPNKIIAVEEPQSQSNHWTVRNCNIEELENYLNSMHKVGQKQVAIARYQDQVTIIMNDAG